MGARQEHDGIFSVKRGEVSEKDTIMEVRTETEPERLREVLAPWVDEATLEVIMSAADKLRAEGRSAGLLEGRRAVLRRQLERRFGRLPDEVAHRLDNAPLPEMDLWTERVLDAPTLEDVFRS
ncbi:MAG: DUF4351 domain-containing protein [Planctomycetota bacterium]